MSSVIDLTKTIILITLVIMLTEMSSVRSVTNIMAVIKTFPEGLKYFSSNLGLTPLQQVLHAYDMQAAYNPQIFSLVFSIENFYLI